MDRSSLPPLLERRHPAPRPGDGGRRPVHHHHVPELRLLGRHHRAQHPRRGLRCPRPLRGHRTELRRRRSGEPGPYLPSQVDQLDSALTDSSATSRRRRPAPPGRQALHLRRHQRPEVLEAGVGVRDLRPLRRQGRLRLRRGPDRRQHPGGYAAAIPASFGKLDQALLGRDIVTHERYAMQYPDAFSKDSTGALCSQMLERDPHELGDLHRHGAGRVARVPPRLCPGAGGGHRRRPAHAVRGAVQGDGHQRVGHARSGGHG